MIRVLALDLSLTATGLARVDGTTATLASPHGADEPEQRILWLREAVLGEVLPPNINDYAQLVAIEGFSYGSKGSTIDQIYGLGWVVRSALHDVGVRYVVIAPSSVKRYATGKGTATKADMRVALLTRTGVDERDDNRVDAWWLRAMTLDHYSQPVVAMPAVNREALAKVDWPAVPAALGAA